MDELFGDVLERTGLSRAAAWVRAGGRRRLHGRSAASDRHRRAGRRRHRRARARDPGPQAAPLRAPRSARGRGRRLSAGRDRARQLPSRDRARAPTYAPTRRRPATRTGCSASSCRWCRPSHGRDRSRSRAARSPVPGDPRPRRDGHVIDIGAPDGGPRDVAVGTAAGLPERVGVLPLRDTVTFPEMLIPLNVGQQRSIELVNDVLRGDRSIVMVASRNPEVETPGARGPLHGRRDRRRGADDPRARRDPARADPGRPAGADRRLGRDRPVSGRADLRAAGRRQARRPS